MNINGHTATRVHGTLQVELHGGGLALLEVDIDLLGAVSGIDHDFHDSTGGREIRKDGFAALTTPVYPRSSVLWARVGPDAGGTDGVMFRLRVPTT